MKGTFSDVLHPIQPEQFEDFVERGKAYISRYIEYSLKKARKFSVLDFGMLKVMILSFGMLLGAEFSRFFQKHRALLLLAFLGCWTYLVWRIFVDTEE